MATDVETIVVKLIGEGSSYERMIKKNIRSTKLAERSFKSLNAQVKKTSKSMVAMGKKMAIAVTVPIAAIGTTGVKAFSKFDSAMTNSTSIMKTTTAQVEAMKKTATGLSTGGKVDKSISELAESYFFLASAGKDAEQSMSLLPKVASFATAGNFDMALATDLLTDAQSALGMSSKDVAKDTENLVKISDELVKANTLANASVQQFAEALTSDAATASKIINAELETTLAILALYADKGKKAAEAGNLFGRAVRLLTKSARENADEFASRNINVIDKATGEYRNFIDIIDDMNKAFAGLTKPEIGKALSDLGFEALAQKSILPLLGATEQLKFYEKELNKAGGTTEDVAEKQMTAFPKQLQVVWNNIEALQIEIGKILAPALIWLGAKVKIVTEWFKKLSPHAKKVSVIIGLIAAAIGPLLIAGALLLMALQAIGSAFAFIGIKGALIIGILAAVSIAFIKTFNVDIKASLKLGIAHLINFGKNVKGFIENWGDNWGRVTHWINKNWKNLLKDMLSLLVLYIKNYIDNTIVMIKGSIRIWAFWQGVMSKIWKTVFSIDYIKWIKVGLGTAVKLYKAYAKVVYETLSSALSGEDVSGLVEEFLETVADDKKAGAALDFKRLGKIAQDVLDDIEFNPFSTFKKTTTDLPDFLGVKTLSERAKKVGEKVGEEVVKAASGRLAFPSKDLSTPDFLEQLKKWREQPSPYEMIDEKNDNTALDKFMDNLDEVIKKAEETARAANDAAKEIRASFVVVDAAGVGSAESLSRIDEFMAMRGAQATTPNDFLIDDAMKNIGNKPLIPNELGIGDAEDRLEPKPRLTLPNLYPQSAEATEIPTRPLGGPDGLSSAQDSQYPTSSPDAFPNGDLKELNEEQVILLENIVEEMRLKRELDKMWLDSLPDR